MAFFGLNEFEATPTLRLTLESLLNTFITPFSDEAEIEAVVAEYGNGDKDHDDNLRAFLKLPGSVVVDKFISMLRNQNMYTPANIQELLMPLNLLGSGWGTFLLTGNYSPFAPFHELSDTTRTNLMKNMLTSYLEPKRMLANVLRALFLMLWLTNVESPEFDLTKPFALTGPDPSRTNAIVWKALGYPGSDPNMMPGATKYDSVRSSSHFWALPKFDIFKQYNITQDQLAALTMESMPLVAERELQYDAIIIGSGAGSGPVALQLSQAGYKVLIIEQGQYQPTENLSGLEAESLERLYQNGASLTTSDKSISILAGNTFGGGTAVNWACCLDPPYTVRAEWAEEYGIKFCTSPDFSTCLRRIRAVMQVHEHPADAHNRPNDFLLRGASLLGFPTQVTGQNGLNEHDCGWCCFGCKYQHKQGSNHSYLPISLNRFGAHCLTSTRVDKILFESKPHWTSETQSIIQSCNKSYTPPSEIVLKELNLNHRFGCAVLEEGKEDVVDENPNLVPETRVSTAHLPQRPVNTSLYPVATGVLVSHLIPGTSRYVPLKISAKIVVCSAGSLHTPLLLKCSNIKHHQLGHNLRLHPVIGVGALYDEEIQLWKGTPMTAVCNIVKDLHKGYGTIIECPSAHIGLVSTAMPWWGGTEFKTMALKLKNIHPLICLNREYSSSGTILASDGEKPSITYNFTPFDRQHLIEGVLAAVKLHIAAGAKKILTPFFGMDAFEVDNLLGLNDPRLEAYFASIRRHGIVNHSQQLFSAHQMGTARMSADASKGPVDLNGEVYNSTNLFVADASLFPTASGVNPMITTMAMAQYVALNAQLRLQQLSHIEEALKEKGLRY